MLHLPAKNKARDLIFDAYLAKRLAPQVEGSDPDRCHYRDPNTFAPCAVGVLMNDVQARVILKVNTNQDLASLRVNGWLTCSIETLEYLSGVQDAHDHWNIIRDRQTELEFLNVLAA